MIKGFKIRLYPTKEQEALMWEHINCSRFIWNYMLALQMERYKNGESYLSHFDMSNLLVSLKTQKEYLWLNNVSVTTLRQTCGDLTESYNRMFAKVAKHPKFKNKKTAKPKFPIRSDRLWFDGKYVHIEKIGRIKYKTDFNIPIGRGYKFINSRIKYVLNKWMLSFSMECENQVQELNDYDMGIDLGIKDTMIVAYGDSTIVFHNINKSKRIKDLKRKIKHTQRTISRKYEANRVGRVYNKTNNIIKEEYKLKKLYARLTNIRHNYIHQSTHKVVSLLPKKIVMEDLNVTSMMKNKHLSKAIQEQCFYEIARQIEYKSKWNGVEFVKANRFYPSSKTCSNCGCIKTNLTLRDRLYVCDECSYEIDRDYNAAINLMRYVG